LLAQPPRSWSLRVTRRNWNTSSVKLPTKEAAPSPSQVTSATRRLPESRWSVRSGATARCRLQPTPAYSDHGHFAGRLERAVKVNLMSAFLAAKHQIPAMLKQGKGSIIFMCTFVGYTVGLPGVCLRGEQIRAHRSDAGPRRGIRSAEHLGSRLSSPRPSTRPCTKPQMRPPSSKPMHEWVCVEARCVTRRAGAGGAVSRL
jgi:NAD(P)-dependent dehydrogenase (short-subunit alcohol dehydrogenase family)